MTGMTLNGNGLANAAFMDEVTPIASYTQVTITNTVMSNSITGVTWADGVMLAMTGGRLEGNASADISNQVAVAGLASSFTDVGFGSLGLIFPVVVATVVESASGTASNGPSWLIGTPGALGASITFTTTHPLQRQPL